MERELAVFLMKTPEKAGASTDNLIDGDKILLSRACHTFLEVSL